MHTLASGLSVLFPPVEPQCPGSQVDVNIMVMIINHHHHLDCIETSWGLNILPRAQNQGLACHCRRCPSLSSISSLR